MPCRYLIRCRRWAQAEPRRNRVFRVVVAGMGFLADSYDLFVINIALLMMKGNDYHEPLTQEIQARISIMALLGAMIGQIVFGFMGDRFGRRSIFVFTACLTIVGNVMQVLVQPDWHFSIWKQLMVSRFVMGLGVGGEYPMAATVTAEVSQPEQRGRNLATVFMMQGVGRLLCGIMLLLSAHLIADPNWQWRFAMLMGVVPMLAAAFFRWLPESQVYRDEVERRVPPSKRAGAICRAVWANRMKLLGTAGSWFILDVLFYGNSLFSADVTRYMGTENTLKAKALQNIYVQLIALPGYISGIALIERWGRKYMQMFGFAGQMAVFAVMAAYQPKLRDMPMLFLVMYALTFFFDDCGPNLTTFVVPAEIFPTVARSTCHGISAALGKAGAAVGGTLFLKVSNVFCPGHECTGKSPIDEVDRGLRLVFWCCAALALLGLVWTWGFVDDDPDPSLEKEWEGPLYARAHEHGLEGEGEGKEVEATVRAERV